MPKPAHARKSAALTTKRPKKKGKPPAKREQAQMLAMSELGMGTYEIGAALARSPHTIRKYVQSPLFTDDKFRELVEEYKSKELIDLTVLNIEARGRLHDLVPTMTPIEAIALMDKSFGQRRLLEGKSTENIFSLRQIISDAHKSPEDKDATKSRSLEKSNQREHQPGDARGQAAEASGGHSDEQSRQEQEEEAQIIS